MPTRASLRDQLRATTFLPTAFGAAVLALTAGTSVAAPPSAVAGFGAITAGSLAAWTLDRAGATDQAVRTYLATLLGGMAAVGMDGGAWALPLVALTAAVVVVTSGALEPVRAARVLWTALAVTTSTLLAVWSRHRLGLPIAHPDALWTVVVVPVALGALGLGTRSLHGELEQARVTSDIARAKLRRSNAAFGAARQRTEEALARLGVVIEALEDGLLAIDAHERVVFANRAFARHLDTAAPQVGAPILDQLPTALRAAIRSALKGEQAAEASLRLAQRQLVGRVTTFAHGQEQPGAVVVVRDVTLEHEIDRMKSDFIAVVSHEMRTPLTSILGFSKLVRKLVAQRLVPHVPETDDRATAAAQTVQSNLDIVVVEGERLATLINDVLDLSKLEAGQLSLKPDAWDAAELVATTVARVQSLVAERAGRVEMVERVDDGVAPVWGDRDRLLQVLLNLVSNALKFTDAGQVVIGIESDETDGAHLWVLDTGPGIPASALETVFEKFRQVGDVLTDRPTGTGLGLPICREIVQLHGGRIWAESTGGDGTTIHVWLPPARDDSQSAGGQGTTPGSSEEDR